MANYSRPAEGFRFKFAGAKANATADAIPPDKYAVAQNVRGYRDNSIQSRPGQSLLYPTGGQPITDIRAFAALSTADKPIYVVRDVLDRVYVGGSLMFTMAGAGASPGATLLPFRPKQSPNPYMYVANGFDYQKFPAPTGAPSKVGIAEPQLPPDAAINQVLEVFLIATASNYTPGGTAESPADSTRVSDVCGAVFVDPTPGASSLWSVQVALSQSYQRFMDLTIGGTLFIVQDIFPPLVQSFNIASIY